MIRVLVSIALVLSLCLPTAAEEFSPPQVPESGRELMPSETGDLGAGLTELLKKGFTLIRPDLSEAARLSASVIATALLISLLRTFSGAAKATVNLAGAVMLSVQLLSSANSMLHLGCDTILELSNYGKLLVPVMAAAMAAQGAVTSSAVLYAGTTVFDAVMSGLIANLFTPLVLIFVMIGIAAAALGDETLKKLQDMTRGFVTWSLKTMLIAYTTYMGITGVVSGTTDAAALKAARLTISTVVPVVGGILSDASEAVLVGVGTMKNAAGVYGILASAAIVLEPFLKIGAHYLVLKGTAAVCTVLDPKGTGGLVEVFTAAMGLILGMTGACCLMLLVSTVCFLRGMG